MCNRNATATWSGFSHQGQVGLIVALREMKRLIDENRQDEFTCHFLEFERHEDFAIYHKVDDLEAEYLSVHQVKAYYSDGHLINSYKSVFQGNPIYERDGAGNIRRDDHGRRIPTGEFEPGQWCPNSNYLHTVVDVENWSAETINEFGNDFRIERYNYEANKFFCNTTESKDYIISTLKNDVFLGNNDGAANSALNRLTYKLDEKIRNEHNIRERKADYDIKFSFSELDLIIRDNTDYSTNSICRARELFYKAFEWAIRAPEFNESILREIEDEITAPLYHLDDAKFLFFMKLINIDAEFNCLNNPHEYFNRQGLIDVFFYILQAIISTRPSIEDIKVVYKKPNGNKKYVLTSINQETGAEEIVMNVVKNSEMLDLLWENHLLINRYHDGTFAILNPDIKNIQTTDIERHNKFMSFSARSGLINRDNTVNNLNNA